MSETTIVYEEDVEEMFEKVKSVMGPLGKYIYYEGPELKTDVVLFNAILYSPKYGKLWYGDVDVTDEAWTKTVAQLNNLDREGEWSLIDTLYYQM